MQILFFCLCLFQRCCTRQPKPSALDFQYEHDLALRSVLLNIFHGQCFIYQERKHYKHSRYSHCFKVNCYQGSEMATWFLAGHQEFLLILRSSGLEQLDIHLIDYDGSPTEYCQRRKMRFSVAHLQAPVLNTLMLSHQEEQYLPAALETWARQVHHPAHQDQDWSISLHSLASMPSWIHNQVHLTPILVMYMENSSIIAHIQLPISLFLLAASPWIA